MSEQGTAEWFADRVGKVTASRISDVMATLKSGGEAASRADYRTQLIIERLTGRKQDSFTSAAMQYGIDTEPLARSAYEVKNNLFIDEVGFIPHPTIEFTGASPDGMVGRFGMVEIKCPNSSTHFEYLTKKVVPQKYLYQMQWQMACAKRKWCDFVSYDNRFPERHQLLVIRVPRDDAEIKRISDEVMKFLGEVDEGLKLLES